MNTEICSRRFNPLHLFEAFVGQLVYAWAEKHKSFLAPIRSQNGGNRLELVW